MHLPDGSVEHGKVPPSHETARIGRPMSADAGLLQVGPSSDQEDAQRRGRTALGRETGAASKIRNN